MDWEKIKFEIASRVWGSDIRSTKLWAEVMAIAFSELVRQLDERFVKREEQHSHLYRVPKREATDAIRFTGTNEPDEPEPQTRLSGTMEPEVQPKAKCECVDDYWITDICEYHGYPSFCCYCGNPLKEKFEKGKNEALSALEALQARVIVSCNDERCGWVGCLVETKSPKHSPEKILCPQCSETTETVTPAWFADLRKQIAELEAQLQDEQP